MNTIEEELRKAFAQIKADLDKDEEVSRSELEKAELWATLLKEKNDREKNNIRNK
tara:strand:+ start:306 stop:470 length:165 start_codon:yes stop_codon:yes gene_type:complete